MTVDQPVPAEKAALQGCDLVMKGGIASGIVYPRAIAALSKTYRLHSIGGSSAGAIAAAAAAAAEYRRQSNDGDEGGFEALRDLPGERGRGDTLANLFKPEGKTRFAWDVAAPLLKHGWGWRSALQTGVALLGAGAFALRRDTV